VATKENILKEELALMGSELPESKEAIKETATESPSTTKEATQKPPEEVSVSKTSLPESKEALKETVTDKKAIPKPPEEVSVSIASGRSDANKTIETLLSERNLSSTAPDKGIQEQKPPAPSPVRKDGSSNPNPSRKDDGFDSTRKGNTPGMSHTLHTQDKDIRQGPPGITSEAAPGSSVTGASRNGNSFKTLALKKEALKQALMEARTRLIALKEQTKSKFTKRINDLNLSIEREELKKKEKERELSDIRSKLDEIQKEISLKESEIQKIEENIDYYRKQIKEINDEFQTISKKLDEAISRR